MKNLSSYTRFFILLSVLVYQSVVFGETKTCTAILTGKVTPNNIDSILPPEVIYPDDIHPRLAKWVGDVKVKQFIAPPATTITCGKPFAHISFEGLKAQGTLPDAIETLPWTKKYASGETSLIPPVLLTYLPSTYDYPLPLVYFQEPGLHSLEVISPDGTSDVCSYKNIDVPEFYITAPMTPDWDASYSTSTPEGTYKWYSDSFKNNSSPNLLIEKPQVKIVCEQSWTYDAEFIWPYIIDESTPLYGLCPGSTERRMKIHGQFSVLEDGKVVGYLDIQKPTVTSTGSITGEYSGSDFSFYIEGKVYTDASGKNKLDLPWFKGGQGISWKYTWTCPDWGAITNSLPAAVGEYFKIINYYAETESTVNPGYTTYDAEGDEKTLEVDMGGQGKVTFKRQLKKVK